MCSNCLVIFGVIACIVRYCNAVSDSGFCSYNDRCTFIAHGQHLKFSVSTDCNCTVILIEGKVIDAARCIFFEAHIHSCQWEIIGISEKSDGAAHCQPAKQVIFSRNAVTLFQHLRLIVGDDARCCCSLNGGFSLTRCEIGICIRISVACGTVIIDCQRTGNDMGFIIRCQYAVLIDIAFSGQCEADGIVAFIVNGCAFNWLNAEVMRLKQSCIDGISTISHLAEAEGTIGAAECAAKIRVGLHFTDAVRAENIAEVEHTAVIGNNTAFCRIDVHL